MQKEFKELCSPARIYFLIAVVGCVFALFKRVPVLAVFMKLLFAFLWTLGLNWLCKKGYKSVSWFLVLFPYIMIGLMMIGFLDMRKRKTHHRENMTAMKKK